MLLNDDMDFGSVALVVAGRWFWRYRSELAPLNTVLLALTGGVVLHTSYPTWWPTVLILTGGFAGTLALFGRWVNLTRGAERGYAAVIVLLIGGWLAAATVVGPFTSPLPAVLGIGGFVLAVPWWAHRRRRARVRVERALDAWPEISEAVGLAGSRIQSAVVDLWGWRARIALARGQTVEDAIGRLPAIESGLGTRRGAARIQPIPERANRLELRIIETDPHADAIGWPGSSVTSITQPIELGVFEDGSPARVSLLRRHALVGGVAGSGKSGGVNVILGNLSACPDVIVWGIDLKRGMELLPWVSCLDRLATTPREAETLLRDAVAILDGRAATLAQRGERTWEPSAEAPALILLVDEYAELVEDAPGAVRYADSIARRGRAPATTLIAATQRPSQKAMGSGAVRSQMDVRISFRVRERRDVDLILGQGMHKAGWHADALDAPGKFLVSAPEHDLPRRARTYLMEDETIRHAAGKHAPRRPVLDPVSVTAVEDGPDSMVEESRETERQHDRKTAQEVSEGALLAALHDAPEEGVSVPRLMEATGMSRPWVYWRLNQLDTQGVVRQVSRGRWRSPEVDSS